MIRKDPSGSHLSTGHSRRHQPYGKSLFVTVSACAEIPFAELLSQMLGKVECLPWTRGRRGAFIELKLKSILSRCTEQRRTVTTEAICQLPQL